MLNIYLTGSAIVSFIIGIALIRDRDRVDYSQRFFKLAILISILGSWISITAFIIQIMKGGFSND